MPALPQRLRRPHPWLAGIALLGFLALVDTFRAPQGQVVSRLYVAVVRVYRFAKPQLGLRPTCRFEPSCSRYSEEAVRRYGLWKGLKLSVDRLRRCRTNVPEGTPDPVPDPTADRDAPSVATKR